jgi:hypothetical protein
MTTERRVRERFAIHVPRQKHGIRRLIEEMGCNCELKSGRNPGSRECHYTESFVDEVYAHDGPVVDAGINFQRHSYLPDVPQTGSDEMRSHY